LKTSIFILLIVLLFSGCNVSQELSKENLTHFENNGSLVCSHIVDGGYRIPGHQEDRTLLSSKTHILIDKKSKVVDLNLSQKPFDLFQCHPLSEKETFQLDDGNYILLNGVAKKLPN
jgi:hypothetical protein